MGNLQHFICLRLPFGRPRLAQQGNNPAQSLAELAALNNTINHTVLEQELGALEIIRQGLSHRLLYHPAAGEADCGPRLGDMDITQHGEASRHAAGRRVTQQHNVG